LLATVAIALFVGRTCSVFAGNIFVSGHDSDFHAALGPNPLGAQNIINRALDFTRSGNNEPILFIQSNTDNVGLGDHTDSEQGLIASGFTAGNTSGDHYVKVNAAGFLAANLSDYSSIFIPSDHGGTLTGDDLADINSRSADILAYLNSGGGLFALAEDGFRTPAGGAQQPQNFGFLPFLATSAPLSEAENGNVLTPFGTSLGLIASDINGNFSHNIFTSTGGMTPVDLDAGGEILSLAWSGPIGQHGVPDAASTLLLLTAALALLRGVKVYFC
jgi:hypothetical protein